ncbi:MAG: hypothetical protein AB7O67_16630 [Vicinamibacterales bacterium]
MSTKKGGKAVRGPARSAQPTRTRAKGGRSKRPTRAAKAAARQDERAGSLEAAQAERERAQGAFLAAFAKVGNVTAACEAAGIGRRTHYNWLEEDPDGYGLRYKDAAEEATDRLEIEARRRAQLGVEKAVFGKLPGREAGVGIVGKVREYSDPLLMFLLRAHRPERFKDRHEVTGKDGAPLNPPRQGLDLSSLSVEDLRALEGVLVKLAPAGAEGATR